MKTARIDYDVLLDWEKEGFSTDEALYFRKEGFSPEESKSWKNSGYTCSKALRWKQAGFNLDQISKLSDDEKLIYFFDFHGIYLGMDEMEAAKKHIETTYGVKMNGGDTYRGDRLEIKISEFMLTFELV